MALGSTWRGLLRKGEAYVLKHTTYSLKSFMKTVLKPRDPGLFALLYNSFTVVKPRNRSKPKLPTIEQLRQIWQQLPTIESRLYFIILSECGLRPSEPFLVSIDDVDFEHGVIRIGKVTETKRAFIAFLRPEVVDWVKREYLPGRCLVGGSSFTSLGSSSQPGWSAKACPSP